MKRLLLVLVAVLALAGCKKEEIIVDGSCVDGSNLVTIEIVYEDEEIEETFQFCTEEEFLLGVLDENAEELLPEYTDGAYGKYLSGLYEYNFETLEMSYYWAIIVNGDYGMLGISEQPVTDGDVFKFEAASF